MSKKYYAIRKGRQTGIFESWDECKSNTHGFKGAEFKSFTDKNEALRYLHDRNGDESIPHEYLAVDVGCRGRIPNLNIEYKLVYVKGNEQIVVYESPVYPQGTNNIGEFLAIVHGIGWLNQEGLDLPIFSDSKTAITWFKRGKANSKLKQTSENEPLFELLNRAEKFLKTDHGVQVLKWETDKWGEIPADYGRK